MRSERIARLACALVLAGAAIGSMIGTAAAKPDQIVIRTGSAGGSWYPIAVGVAKIFEDAGVRAGTDFGGGVANVIAVATGQGDIGMTYGVMVKAAENGVEPYKKKITGVVGMATLMSNYFTSAASVESGIKSFAELKGRRVALLERNTGGAAYSRMLFRAYGLSADDMNVVVRGSVSALVNAVRDRRAEFIANMPTLNDASMSELATSLPVRFLPVDDAHFAKLKEINAGFVRSEIPAGMYKGQDEAVPTFSVPMMFVVHENMPEDDGYWIIRTLVENIGDLRPIHKNLNDITAEKMANVGDVALHPGVAKYYKEIGAR